MPSGLQAARRQGGTRAPLGGRPRRRRHRQGRQAAPRTAARDEEVILACVSLRYLFYSRIGRLIR